MSLAAPSKVLDQVEENKAHWDLGSSNESRGSRVFVAVLWKRGKSAPCTVFFTARSCLVCMDMFYPCFRGAFMLY